MQIWLNYVDQILIYAAFALSLNLLLGYAGQVSVAHAAFGAIGGYTMGYLVMTHGWNFVPTAILGMLFAFLAGTLVVAPGAEAVRRVPDPADARGLVGDHRGVHDVPAARRHLRPDQPPQARALRLDACAVRATGSSRRSSLMLGIYAICWRIGESAFGRVLKGIREDGEATQALGKNVFAYKVGVFGITAGLAGLRRAPSTPAGSASPRRRSSASRSRSRSSRS